MNSIKTQIRELSNKSSIIITCYSNPDDQQKDIDNMMLRHSLKDIYVYTEKDIFYALFKFKYGQRIETMKKQLSS